MDFIRLLGCAICLFSTTLTLYFVLYYYPTPFYVNWDRRSFAETDLKDSRKHGSGFRQGKVPVAERLQKAQRKRILGEKILPDVPRHRGHAFIDDWEGEQKDKGDRLDEARILDSNRLSQAQTQDSESWKQISNPNRLHEVQRLDDHRSGRLQMLDDRVNQMKRPDEQSRDLKMQDLVNVIKKYSPDTNWSQEMNNQEQFKNLFGIKTPDAEKLLDIKTPTDEQLQKMKSLYNEISRRLDPHTSLLNPDQKQLLERALDKLYNEIHNPENDRLNVEKEEQFAKDLEAKNFYMQKDRLQAKDWEAMRDRLMAVRKDRLDLISNPDEPLPFEYGKQVTIVETSDLLSRAVPEESFHGTEHMLGR